jgi:Kef-type K+ transport system membrane component KefB
LGWLAPQLSAALFPAESLETLGALSQIGLLLFMFLVGLELDPHLLRGRGHIAVVISHVSIIAPFLLGVLLALFLYPRLSDGTIPFHSFALFIGIAMSITAFPVLARILIERNMLRSPVGSVTITCAAVDDVTGWCLLAAVVLIVQAGREAASLWLTIGGSALFVVVMILGVRRLLRRLEGHFEEHGQVTQNVMAIILILVLLSALVTELLGIHALFGAFLLGAIMPRHHRFVQALVEKLEYTAVVLLMPLFFAYTGLRTSIGLVSGASMWLYCGLIILVAVVGKFGASTLAARFTGMPWREAAALGILMNTRGLMELVVLNIGLDIGILSPTMFTMMVLMALITTLMTSPLLEWIYFRRLVPASYGPPEADTAPTLVARDGEATF